jgi:hypothetical protein
MIYDVELGKVIEERSVFTQDYVDCIRWMDHNVFAVGGEYDSIKIYDRRFQSKSCQMKINIEGVRRIRWS